VTLAIKFLTAQSAVSAIVSNRIYPYHLPQGASPPCVIVRLISETLPPSLDGDHGPRFGTVMIESLTTNPPATETLAETVNTALKDRRHQTVTLASGPYKVSFFRSGSDQSDYDDGRTVFRRMTQFDVTWQPA
jgi:hypothetical protein